jgi:cytoskeleton protein RodZ
MSDMDRSGVLDGEEAYQQGDEVATTQLSPGAQLSARREALNLSIEQVASQLNLAPRQIRAIESDNYAALPGMASTRGFIRSYAKLLNVEATPLLEVVAKEATAAEDAVPLRRELPNVRFPETRLSARGHGRLLSRPVVILLLLLSIAAGLFLVKQSAMQSLLPASFHFGTDNRLNPLASPAPAGADIKDSAPVAVQSDNTTNETAVVSGAVQNDVRKGHDIVTNEVAAANAVPAASPTSVPTSVAATPTGMSGGDTKDLLTLKLREDSWVEIKRPDNSTLVAALLKAGTTESFKISGPVSVIVGNAAGVDATLRGKPIELKANAKTNVARLTLK